MIETLTIRPWPDPIIDTLGHDPRSEYVERFWLGVLGPTPVWLLRWVAARLDVRPEGFGVHLPDLAGALGVGHTGWPETSSKHPLRRTIERCCDFDVAAWAGSELLVRRHLPPLTRRQLGRLPEDVQETHRQWQEQAVRERAS